MQCDRLVIRAQLRAKKLWKERKKAITVGRGNRSTYSFRADQNYDGQGGSRARRREKDVSRGLVLGDVSTLVTSLERASGQNLIGFAGPSRLV